MSASKKIQNIEKRAVLSVKSGSGLQESIKLRRDATIIGRDKADVMIDDNEVSSTHCQIQNVNGTYHIFDMNSTNGTFVNNERIVKAKLTPGDSVMIGGTTMVFSLEDEKSVRHITTIFKHARATSDSRGSATIVDTLIESELRNTQAHVLKLQVSYPDGKKDELEFRQKVLFIGRASSFGRFEADTEISRKHLLIKVNDGGEPFIEDQGSTNGVFLNGKQIKGMHPVKPTDEVRIGSCRMRIVVEKN